MKGDGDAPGRDGRREVAGLLHEINVKLTRGSWWSGWLCGGGSAVDRGRRSRGRGVAVDGR